MSQTRAPMFAALRLLENVAQPLRYGHEPLWRSPRLDADTACVTPSWNWTGVRTDIPEDDEPVTLDYNGAFLAALGGVDIPHSELRRAEEVPDAWALEPRRVLPGYYKIQNFAWAFSGTIVSPLGDNPKVTTASHVWVAAPTLVLLLELLAEGTLGDLVITDAYLPRRITNFREWAKQLKVVRNGLLDERDKADTHEDIAAALDRYKAFKEGYGAAFSMMLTGEGCKTRRPDWAKTVYAQHAATSWRKAWRFSAIGPLLAMGDTDTLTVLQEDLKRAVLMPKLPPVKLDPTGRLLGHVKVKAKEAPAPAPAPAAAADDFTLDETDDIL